LAALTAVLATLAGLMLAALMLLTGLALATLLLLAGFALPALLAGFVLTALRITLLRLRAARRILLFVRHVDVLHGFSKTPRSDDTITRNSHRGS
jgi:hypothetical protein